MYWRAGISASRVMSHALASTSERGSGGSVCSRFTAVAREAVVEANLGVGEVVVIQEDERRPVDAVETGNLSNAPSMSSSSIETCSKAPLITS